MTDEQKETLLHAEDILIHLMNDLKESGKERRTVQRLDLIISKIENILMG